MFFFYKIIIFSMINSTGFLSANFSSEFRMKYFIDVEILYL